MAGSGLGIVEEKEAEEALSWLSGREKPRPQLLENRLSEGRGTVIGLGEPSSLRVETWP